MTTVSVRFIGWLLKHRSKTEYSSGSFQLTSPILSENTGSVIQVGESPMHISVPYLENYQTSPYSGISRVINSLTTNLTEVSISDADVVSSRLPILRNVIKKPRVHGHSDLLLLPNMTSAIMLAYTSMPSVVIVHDIGILDCPEDRFETNWITKKIILYSLQCLRKASQIVTVSCFTANRLKTWLPEVDARIVTIPSGVSDVFYDFELSRNDSRVHLLEILKRPILRHPLLLYVGTESPRKNVRLLLQMLTRVKQYFPSAHLMKIGNAGNKQFRTRTLQEMSRLGLTSEDVSFVDQLSDWDLAAAYRAADLYVSGSLYEGFCLPVAEARVIGTPVVAVEGGAISEIIGPHDFMTKSDPQIFTETVIAQLGNRSAKPVGGNRSIPDILRWSEVARQYYSVFEMTIDNHREDSTVV